MGNELLANWRLSAFSDETGTSAGDQIRALQAAGLKYMDLRGIDDVAVTDLSVDQALAVKSKLDGVGITVQMMGSSIGKIDIADDFEIDLGKLRRLGEVGPALDCRAIRMFSYYNKGGLAHDAWRDATLERLGALRDEARNLGLVLYHENERHIFGDLAVDVRVIGDALRDDKTFRMIFDFDNYNQSSEDVWQAWLLLRDQVDAFHLKDSVNLQHVPVGRGTGAVKRILEDALARGWSGPLSVEPHLKHSGAVASTNPSGGENQSFKEMSAPECFAVACSAATELLAEIAKGK